MELRDIVYSWLVGWSEVDLNGIEWSLVLGEIYNVDVLALCTFMELV